MKIIEPSLMGSHEIFKLMGLVGYDIQQENPSPSNQQTVSLDFNGGCVFGEVGSL